MVLAQHIFKPYLDPGEKILVVCHRHPLIMLIDLLKISFLGFLIPAFLYYLFPDYWIFFVCWLLISFIKFMKIIIIWYHDVLLLTTVSMMDFVWNNLFSRTSSRLEYHMIEGVTLEINGFWKVVFNYGDVNVQGQGGGTCIRLRDAINPKKVEKMIMMHQEKFVSDQTFKDSQSLKNLLTSLIRQHVSVEETKNIRS